MADSKFYWVRLDYRRFESGQDLDFLMSQKNGAEYVVLYQMLCLNTRNTCGEMVVRMNEMIVPFDVDRIVRDCKYFSRDTVIIALELYRKLGMIYEQENGILKIANYEGMVGSETTAAKRMRDMRQRDRQALPEAEKRNNVTPTVRNESVTEDVTNSVTEGVTMCEHRSENVTIEIRDKIKSKEIKESYSLRSYEEKKESDGKNIPPTLEEVREYVVSHDYSHLVDSQQFIDFYTARGWMIGKVKMKNWQAAVRTWVGRAKQDKVTAFPRKINGTSSPEEIQESLHNTPRNEDGSVNF